MWFNIICLGLVVNCAGYNLNIERWIQADDLYKINIGMSKSAVIGVLGEPLFIEAESDDDGEIIIDQYIYNFRTKKYSSKILSQQTKGAGKIDANNTWGRTTKIQFTFINNQLTGWEEENHILLMASEKKKPVSSLTYLSLFLNLILTIKVFII